MRLQNCNPIKDFCANFINLIRLHYQLLNPQRPRSRSSKAQLLIWTGTKRYECQVHGIHKSCHEISVVYSVCSTCHHCIGSIRVLITGMWKCIGFDSFACGFRFWSNFFRFWMIFSTVLRFLMGPNAPFLQQRNSRALTEGNLRRT